LVGAPAADAPVGELPLRDDIIVRGWSNSIVDYLRAADAFLYPSHADGMSNALLEAMACGLAPVATRAGAAESIINDGNNGLLIDIEDRVALRGAIETLYNDPQRRLALGHAAAGTMTRFSIACVAKSVDSQYQELVSWPARP
jgi:glycosyltransferase involved in cell wall biosynthesis